MPKHEDFKQIYSRFIKQYKEEKGKEFYYAFLEKKGYDDTQSLSGQKGSKGKKEFLCAVRGFEIKETAEDFHIYQLWATDHVDAIDDLIPKETLDSFAEQINTLDRAKVFGVHHSEGRPVNPEFYGKADSAEVIELTDNHFGLYVDTKLLKEDPMTPELIQDYKDGKYPSCSITYDTLGFSTTDFDFVDGRLVRILNPDTLLFGGTAATKPVNIEAITMGYGFKEFKELVKTSNKQTTEVVNMTTKEETKIEKKEEEKPSEEEGKKEEENSQPSKEESKEEAPKKEEETEDESEEDAEKKEFKAWKAEKLETKETARLETIAKKVISNMEVKEKVLKQTDTPEIKEVKPEFKEFKDVLDNSDELELKEQFRRAASFCDAKELNWQDMHTSAAESREFKNFGVRGTKLEFKGLGLTTNQNSDTDYLQSAAELQDVYDPVIYNALNQQTLAWNLLSKDDYSKKGNNQVQFTLKTAANTSASFYSGNAVVTGNVTRLKYMTKFKKLQVGVSVDGDMIAAARGGPVNDVFAQEVMDSTLDMLAVLNLNLFAEKGAESDAETIGFEYVSDSAGNTDMYNLTRSTTNLLSPDSASDTYINQSSARISMTNLRGAIRQAVTEGANKSNLVFITAPLQGDMLRNKFDDSRRMLTARDTDFGFSTDLWVDGIPVFEDKDCNTDDWWLIDKETHRVAIWVPPTIERLGKTADSEDAFIKMYFAIYNRAPRRLVQIYGCATS